MSEKILKIINDRIDCINADIKRLEEIEDGRSLQLQEEKYLIQSQASLCELNNLKYVITKVINKESGEIF